MARYHEVTDNEYIRFLQDQNKEITTELVETRDIAAEALALARQFSRAYARLIEKIRETDCRICLGLDADDD